VKRGMFLILVLALCLVVPLTAAADSLYIGDYCWTSSYGPTLIFSAFFLGYDSNGHEIINYIGRWKAQGLNDFPLNGNCIDTFMGPQRVYKCNLLVTYGVSATIYGNDLLFAVLDYFTLDGEASGVGNQINGSSLESAPLTFTLKRIACPVW
jgi:hypothetical protein